MLSPRFLICLLLVCFRFCFNFLLVLFLDFTSMLAPSTSLENSINVVVFFAVSLMLEAVLLIAGFFPARAAVLS